MSWLRSTTTVCATAADAVPRDARADKTSWSEKEDLALVQNNPTVTRLLRARRGNVVVDARLSALNC